MGYCKGTQMKGCCRKREKAVPRFLQENKPTVYSLDLNILLQRFGKLPPKTLRLFEKEHTLNVPL